MTCFGQIFEEKLNRIAKELTKVLKKSKLNKNFNLIDNYGAIIQRLVDSKSGYYKIAKTLVEELMIKDYKVTKEESAIKELLKKDKYYILQQKCEEILIFSPEPLGFDISLAHCALEKMQRYHSKLFAMFGEADKLFDTILVNFSKQLKVEEGQDLAVDDFQEFVRISDLKIKYKAIGKKVMKYYQSLIDSKKFEFCEERLVDGIKKTDRDLIIDLD